MNSQVSAGEPADGRRRPEHWPVRFGTVPRLTEYFSPRPETGFDISIRPAHGETAVLVPRTQAGGAGEHPLTGMGGTGKTQLAAALARFLWAAGAVDLLAWVHAASRDSLITGYAQAGAAGRSPPAHAGPPAAARRVLGCLPLGLTQAAAVIADTGIDCQRSHAHFADRRRQMAVTQADRRAAIVAATWSISLDLADSASPPGLARPALALIALLDPGGIPGAVLPSRAASASIRGPHAPGPPPHRTH